MEITYFGNSLFRIKTKKATILVGAEEDNLPKIKADVICFSQKLKKNSFDNKSFLKDEILILDEAGEYEVASVTIFGYDLSSQGGEDNTAFAFEFRNQRVVHLGNLKNGLKEKQIEQINGADVLFVPVGGGQVISSEDALKLIASIEPDIAVPMHYLTDKKSSLKLEQSLSDFLKEAGVEKAEVLDKLTLSSSEIKPEPAKRIVVLKNKSS